MPKSGSQVVICNLPIRFDTYSGCSHNCKYCFTYRKYDISTIKKNEGAKAIERWIKGERSLDTFWCDWDIPLHWGGMSDPFQPAEKKYKYSLEVLKLLAQSKYPFVVSTKNTLPLTEPYFSLFKQCNCVFQCSMVCPSLSKIEEGAPHFEERLNMMREMSKIVPRTIVRCQPYMIEFHKEIMAQIPRIAEAGVYGIVYEGLKMQKKSKGLVKNGADFVYPKNLLKNKFQELKDECHKYGLKFFAGENRLRAMGDSLTCCGCEGLEGFEVHKYNLNYYCHKPEELHCTERMKEIGTSQCFKILSQKANVDRALKKLSFKEVMDTQFKDKSVVKNYIGE